MSHEVVSKRLYFTIFGLLLLGTFVTVAVTYLDLGRFNLVVALLIAFTKATLVVMFFMHVKQSSQLTKVFVFTGIFFTGILLLLTFSDYLTRSWLPLAPGW